MIINRNYYSFLGILSDNDCCLGVYIRYLIGLFEIWTLLEIVYISLPTKAAGSRRSSS